MRAFLRYLALVFGFASVPLLQAQSGEPLKTVVPVSISPLNGSITVGSTVYSMSSASGVQMLALKRQPDLNHLDTPVLLGQGTFTDADSANTFLSSQLKTASDAFLIVSSAGNYSFPLHTLNLIPFGSSYEFIFQSGSPSFIFVGNGGLAEGSAHEKYWDSPTEEDGYLAPDSNGNYTFIQTDYVSYDLTLDGSIKIGSHTYTAAAAGSSNCANSTDLFHVVVLDRQNPWSAPLNDNVYCTAQSDSDLSRLASDLSSWQSRWNERILVVIASAGHPIPSDWNFGGAGDPRMEPLSWQILQLGGYPETINSLTPQDTYTLVGAFRPPAGTRRAGRRARESSSLYPGPATNHDHATGELHGVLARGLRGNWYSPLNADPTGLANMGLYGVLAQSAPFPHPANSDELQAFQTISTQLCGSDCLNVRNEYGNLNVSIPDYISQLAAMQPPGGESCSAKPDAPFCVMKQQLTLELNYVADIRHFYTNMQTLWLGSGTESILSLLTTYNKLQQELNPPSTASTQNLVDPIVNFFLSLGSLIPDVGPLFGLADAGFNLGTSLTTDPQGNPAINLTSTVANLEQQAITLFNGQATTTGTQFALIYQDWGRLSALGENLRGAQPGSPWYWGGSSTGQVLQAMEPAIEASYYQSFLTALYSIAFYVPGGRPDFPSYGDFPVWQQPLSYGATIYDSGQGVYFNVPPFDNYVTWTYPSDPNSPATNPDNNLEGSQTIIAHAGWLAISLQTTPSDPGSIHNEYQPVDRDTLAHLFKPVSRGGLGIFRPAFFEGWPFPHLVCDRSDYFSSDVTYHGCDWGSGSPIAESLPSHLTKITMGISSQNDGQGQVDVRVRIRNSGTVELRSVLINQLRLRTLAGSGEATLVDPVGPLQLEGIAPGDFQSLSVRINVPASVKSLALYADGSVDTGESEHPKFSIGGVIRATR